MPGMGDIAADLWRHSLANHGTLSGGDYLGNAALDTPVGDPERACDTNRVALRTTTSCHNHLHRRSA